MSKETLKDIFKGVKEEVSLKDYSSFKIGGKCRYFFEANSREEIIRAIEVAKRFDLPFFIIGGGSNILFLDKKFNGLVIKINNKEITFNKNIVKVGAGLNLYKLLTESVDRNLSGLEWAIGIPGTVGGAIYGNAGAFFDSMASIIKDIEVLNVRSLKIRKFSLKECKFGYKESIFKKDKQLVILSANLKLNNGNIKDSRKEMLLMSKKRKNYQPIGLPSAGCVFKNHFGTIKDKKIIKYFPEIEIFNKNKFIPAGYLIEKCGLKGRKIFDAQISEKHANFIINLGNARSKDVLNLIKIIKKSVKKKFNIILEEEIQIFN